MVPSPAGTNWSGNITYAATALHHPRSAEEIGELVTSRRRIRALGSRHSFTTIADSTELIALDAMPDRIEFADDRATVTVPAGATYAQVASALSEHGLALHNLASLPHISVAGAVATGTHGSGDALGSLATAVTGLELVTAEGTLLRRQRGEPGFEGLVVGLGALGIVTRVTLAVQPAFEVAQCVYGGLGWDTLLEHFDAVMAGGDSVSVFHRAGAATEQLWVKRRWPGEPFPDAVFGARAVAEPRNPVAGADAANATEQLGVPGPWSERLPHFRSGFTPSSGAEIQSELLIGREHAVAAIAAMRGLSELIAPLLFVGEIRTVAADELWLSPAYGRDTVALHFTWHPEPVAVAEAVAALERALAPLGARPHWGKFMAAEAAQIAALYPRMDEFLRLRAMLDPRGVFVNDWLVERVLGSGRHRQGQR